MTRAERRYCGELSTAAVSGRSSARATALLAVAEGSAFIHAAWQAGLHSGTTVADLVGRFNRHGLAATPHLPTGRDVSRRTFERSRPYRLLIAQRTPVDVPTGRRHGR